jgi:dTDP-glucose 4,6-dehydratase
MRGAARKNAARVRRRGDAPRESAARLTVRVEVVRSLSSLLVTGGAGFIGANFVLRWLSRRPRDVVVVLDALTYAANAASLAPASAYAGYRFVRGDINDGGLVRHLMKAHAIDTLVHFAAQTHVDRSIADPEVFVRTNVLGTQCLLEAARSVWRDGTGGAAPGRFHHVSTDEVLGESRPGDGADVARWPSSPYAASKAGADLLVRAWHRTYGLDVTITRGSNTYGPLQNPEKLVPKVITRALCGLALPVYGDGRHVRDWLHVDDHCAAVEAVLQRGEAGATYDVAGGAARRNIDLVEQLCHLIDEAFRREPRLAVRYPQAPPASGDACAGLIRRVADRPGHDYRYALDTAGSEAALGLQPAVELDRGLAATVDWYLANETWWRDPVGGAAPPGPAG